MTKKFIILTLSIGIPCAALGAVAGVMIGQQHYAPKVDYGAMDIDNLEDDNDATYEKYKKTDASKYLKEFESYELVNIAFKKVGEHDCFHTIGKGMVDASGIKQTIRSNYVKSYDDMFWENISASNLVQVAWRFYQTSNTITTFEGKYKSTETATYTEDKKTDYVANDFEENWGKQLTRPSIYIVSSKTTKKGEVKEQDGNYVVSLDLDPNYSVARYVKQMQRISGLSKPPVFESVHIDFTLDKTLLLKEISINEHYTVSMFGTHDSIGTLVETFTYDEEKSIPTYSEDANYEK